MTRPVTPRHAASLVIYRRAQSAIEVFMGRRHAKARFKPDVYVFPGGMVERADYNARPATPFDHSVTDKLAVAGSVARGRALAMAAVRETFEETGMLAAVPGDVGNSVDPSWRSFKQQGLAPNLAELQYLGRAVTPTFQSMRFHARFFFTSVEHLRGDIDPSHELEDLQWVRLGEHQDLRMMRVTEFMLDTLKGRLAGELDKAPFISFKNDKAAIVWQ